MFIAKSGRQLRKTVLKKLGNAFALSLLSTLLVSCSQGKNAVDEFLGDIGGEDETPTYALDLDPATYDFGTVLITTTTAISKTVTVTNNSKVTLYIGTISSSTSPDFTLSSETCTSLVGGLASLNSCTFTVDFLPLTAGTKNLAISLQYGPATNDQTSTTSGNFTGFGAAPAQLLLSDGPAYNFGPVVVSATAEKSFSITNAGNIAATTVVGSGLAAPFSFKGGSYPGTGGTCGVSIAGGATCSIVVTFNPLATGAASSSINLDYYDGEQAQVASRTVQGTGATPASLDISDGPIFDYGTFATGATNDKAFTVSNSGGVSATSVAGSGLASPYTFKGGSYPGTGGTCSSNIASGANCTIVVTFAPSLVGASSDTIDIGYNDGLTVQTASRGVQGNAVSPALISISNSPTYDFGTVVVGNVGEVTLTLMNAGSFSASAMGGSGLSTPFAFKGGSYPGTGGTCATSLAAGGTCTVVLTYTPVGAGSFSGTMIIGYNNGVNTQTSTRAVQGTAVAPALIQVSNGPTYDFGSRPIGSSTDFTFTVANAGGITATSLTGSGLGIPFTFKGGSYPGTGGTCGSSLAAAANCSIVVTYAPVSAGAHTDTIDFSYNNGLTSVSSTRDIQGTGVTPASLAISDAPTYDYGSQPIGKVVDKTFTVSNSGGFAASSVAGSGLAAPFNFKGGSFPGTGGTCAATIASSTSCTLVVSYSPSGLGLTTDQLDLGYNDGVVAQTASRPVQGTGVNPGLLVVSNSPAYDFGIIATGGFAEATLTVTNTGDFQTSAMMGTGLAAPFTFKGGVYPGTGGTCGLTLNPLASCNVVVRFAPTTTGALLDNMDIAYDNGVSSQLVSRTLQGVGALPAQLNISDSPTYNYGTQPVGISVTKVFTITNAGGVTAGSITGSGLAAPYSFVGGSFPGTGGTCTGTLAASNSCTMAVEYNPSTTGFTSDTIDISYNDTVANQNSLRTVQGTAVTPGILSISNNPTFDIGTVAVGGSADGTLTVTNTGSFLASSISGSGLALPFTFKGGSYPGSGGTCGASLNPGNSCSLVVSYLPTSTGVQTDTIDLSYSNGVSVQTASRDIQGTGATPASLGISDSPNYDYGTVAAGASVDKSFTVTNAGGVSATSVSGGGLAAPFTFKGGSYPGTSGTCGSTILSGATCTIVVTFNPSTTGSFSDAIDLTYTNGVNAVSSSRSIQGIAVNPASLAFSDGPTFSFGTIPSTSSAEKTFTVTNSGDVSATSMSGTGLAAPFAFKGGTYPGTGGTCSTSLAASLTCTVIVVFNPAVDGSYSDTAVLNYNNGALNTAANRDLQGVGAPPGVISISDGPTYNFGSWANGSTREKTLTLTNTGGVGVTAMTGSGLAAPFNFKGGSYPGTGATCSGTLAATVSCTVIIEFSPTSVNSFADTLDITYNDGLVATSSSRALQGTAVTPASLSLSDGPTYDFGTVATGATTEKQITVTNSGSFAASSMAGGGLALPFNFKGGTYPGIGGNCATNLNPGATCTIVVTYSPTATGIQTDTINISYNDGASLQTANRDLQGLGADPALITISDGVTYNYGTLANGGSADKSFTITNAGGVPATSVSGSGLAAPFSFKGGTYPGTGGNCGTTIAAGANCTVVVTYNPSAIGTQSDALDINYINGVSGQTSSRALTGTAVAPANLAITDAPTYDFGTVAITGFADKTFTITNTGDFAASSISGSGLAAPFSFKGGSYPGTGGNCGASLTALNSCTIVVTFSPTVTGVVSDTIDINYNNGASAQVSSRNIQGTGQTPASLSISGGPTFDYGTRATGSTIDQTFTVSNSGGVNATTVAGGGLAAPFSFKGGSYPGTGGTCTITIIGFSSCTIIVTYAPTATGLQGDSIDLTYYDGVNSQSSSRAIQGTGASPALLSISEVDPYDYGTLAAGGSSDHTFVVSNTGGYPASSISGGGLGAPYSFKGGSFPGTGGNCTGTLNNGSSCNIVVTFAPTIAGVQTDTIDLAYNDGANAQTASRGLTGTAVTPAIITITDSPIYDFGTQPNTITVDKVFTLNNTGSLQATTVAGSGLAAPFSFKGGSYPGSGGTCGATINAGSNCTIIVSFNPTASGGYNDTISISYFDGAQARTSNRDVQGAGAPPASLAVSDGPTYNYGSLSNGSSADKAFTITNNGGVPATSVVGAGLASPFTFKGGSFPGTGGTCTGTLNATATCTMVVTFNPTTLGLHSDTIDVSYNDGLVAQSVARDVQGTSVAPASLTISDSPLYDYGTLATGASADKTFTVTNAGSFIATSLTGSGLVAPFSFKGGTYPGTGGTCTSTLNAAASCTIVVRYAPTSTGTQTDTINVDYFDGTNSQTTPRDVQGVGAAPALIDISDGPVYNFGTIASGGSAEKSFTLTNNGGVTASSISGGGLAPPYSFKGGSFPGTGGSCTSTLAASATCTVVVSYNPSGIATHTDTIDVTYFDAVNFQTSNRDLTGTAVAPATLDITDGPTYNFGTLANGATLDKTFTVTNNGSFSATSLAGSGLAAPFTFKGGSYPGSGGTCGTSLNAAISCTIVVTFAPTVSGLNSDTIDLSYYNGASTQVANRAIQGTGAAPASLSFSDGPTYNFGTLATGATAEKTLTVTNGGGVTATGMSGSGLASPFEFKGGSYPGAGATCGSTLLAAGTCTVIVVYAPSGTGTQSDTVEMAYFDGVTSQNATRDIQGTGAAPALLAISETDPFDFGSIAQGGTLDKTFTISNTGGVPATSVSGSGIAAPFTFKGGSFPGTGGTCAATLAASTSCTVIVTFAPASSGLLIDTMDIIYNNGLSTQTTSRIVQGTGVTPAILTISDGPTYDYGNIPNTGSADKTFSVTNSGSLQATLMSGAGLAAPFSFKDGAYPGTGGNCGATLNAGASCNIVVTFNPASTGSYGDSIDISYFDGALSQTAARSVQGVGAIPANLTMSDGPTYNFGTVANGSTTDKTIVVTNAGGVPATALAGSGLAAPFSFKGGSYPGTGGTCTLTLAAAATCNIIITYNPSTIATHNDTIDISYNNGLTGQTSSRDVVGSAVAPGVISITDSPTYDFGTIPTGGSADRTFTLTNTGNFAVSAMAGSGLAAPFSFKGGSYPGSGGNCSGTLNPSSTCTIVVTFAPTGTGLQSDTIDIGYYDGAASQSSSRAVQGTGAAPATLTLSDSDPYNYGTLPTGASADRTFILTNIGGVSAISISGGGLAPPYGFKGGTFPGTGGNCTTTLASSGTCNIVVTYSPSTVATQTDTLIVSYNDGVSSQSTTRDLTGTGVAPASLTLSDSPTYDFGTLANGATLDKTFTLTNGGGFAASTITGTGLAAPYSFKGGSYPGTGGTCSASLNSGANCTIVVTFAPTVSGLHTDTIDINYNTGSATTTSSRNVQGISAAPANVTITDSDPYDYGTVATGASADRTFTITNTGGVAATAFGGSGLAAPFTFKDGLYPGTSGNCTGSLASGASCTVVVTFAPTGTGLQTDTLVMSYNNGVSSTSSSRDVQGTGASPAFLAISDANPYNFGTIAVGGASDKSFTITNSGGVPATGVGGSGLTIPFTFKGASFPGTGGTCTAIIAAGATCTVIVTYTPVASGTLSDTMDITYANGVVGGQIVSRDVQGTGVTPASISITDGPSYDYGSVPATGSADKTFTLTNTGDLQASSMAGAGLVPPFSFKGGLYPGTGGTCVTTLNSLATCTVVVTFNPTVTGGFSDTMDINYNNGVGSVTSSRDIQGTGATAASLTISGSPTYDFGIKANGSTTDATLTVTNGGGVPATGLSGSGLAAPFSFKDGTFPGTGGTCVNGGSIAAGGSCTIILNFAPSSIAVHTDTVIVGYNNGLSAQTSTRDLQGEAVAPASLAFSDGPSYDYGTVPTGGSLDKSFTVTNSGNVTATGMSGSGLAGSFSFKGGTYPGTGGSCSTTLAASLTCTVVVTFAPTSTGLKNDTIDLTYNDGAVSQTAQRDVQGTGATPATLTLSDSDPYNYGTLPIGASGDRTFVLTNSGGVAATAVGGSGLASPFNFKGGIFPGTGGNCIATLAPGANCNIVVTYAPGTAAVHTGTMVVNYNNGVSVQSTSRALTGTGVTPASLSISDSPTYDFGTLANGFSIDKTFTITNGGGFAASTVTGTGLAAPYSFKGGSYPGTGGSCSASISAGANCTIVVTFAPTVSGTHTDTIDINYFTGASSTTTSRDVQGTSAAPANITISDSDPYDYGTVATGASRDRTFTIANAGGVAATSLGGSGLAAPFTFKGGTYPGTGGNCTNSLAAGANCSVVVTFTPSGTGLATDSLVMDYNNGVITTSSSRALQGTGATPANLTISDSDPYDYGNIANGGSADRTFTITNTGGVNATGVSGSGLAPPFSFKGGGFPGTGGSCIGTINAGANCTVVVTFAPTTLGFASDAVDITYNNGVSAGQVSSRSVQGTGVTPASITISDGTTYNFGNVVVTGSGEKTFTLTNTGAVAATSVAGTGLAAPFTFKGGSFPGTGGDCTGTLNPAGTCLVVVVFAPVGLGTFTDTIDIGYNNGVGSVTSSRDVQGTGVTAANITISGSPTYNFGNRAQGSSTDGTLTLTNAGGFTASSIGGSGLAAPFTFKDGTFPGTGGTCVSGGSLAPAATCTVVLTYTPAAQAVHNDTLDIGYNNGLIATTSSRDVTGTGVAPANITITDSDPYDYGTVPTGGSGDRTFTLTNSGAVTATALSGSGLAAPFSFKGGTFPGTGGTCVNAGTITPSGTCTIVVTFAPTGTGLSSDTIDINYNNGAANVTSSRQVQGTGATPATLTLSDSDPYNFGTLAIGSTGDRTFVLTNSGGVSATGVGGSGLAAPYTFKGGIFPGTGGNCTTSLSAGGNCNIVVTYAPIAAATNTDTMIVSYNDGVAAQSTTRDLTGTGVTPASLTLSDSPSYDYGTIANGFSVDKTFTITNGGGFGASAMGGSGLALPFLFKGGSGYPGTGGTCSASLSAAATCTIVVTFAPTTSGTFNDTVDVGYNNGAVVTTSSRDVQGTGAAPASITISDSDPYDYGTVATGASADRTFTISNAGGVAATSLGGSGLAAPFTFKGGIYPGAGGSCTTTLSAGANCSVVVTFTPTGTGPASGALVMGYNNGVITTSSSRAIQGTGAAPANLTITDSDPYNYGNVANGGSADRTFTITNTGGVSATGVSGTGLAPPFSFKGAGFPGTGGNCTGSILAGANCTVVVTFAPTSLGVATDAMDITYNNGVSAGQTSSRSLQGTGVAPASITISDGTTYNFGNVVVTSSAEKSFTLTNTGAVAATTLNGSGLAAPFTFKGGSFPGTGGDCAGTLNPSATCLVVVVFAPTGTGTASDTIDVTYNNGVTSVSSSRDVQGTGVTAANITISGSPTYDFGSRAQGSSTDGTLTLTNAGGFTASSIGGTGLAAPFTFKDGTFPGTGGTCVNGGSLAPAATCTVVLTYTPASQAVHNDTLDIGYNNGLITTAASRDVTGTGVAPANITITDSDPYDYGTVPTGGSGDRAFTLTNTGAVTATALTGTGLASPFTFKGGSFPGTGGSCVSAGTITPAGTCTIVVTFAPTGTGLSSDTIDINYNNGAASVTSSRQVQGTGATPATLTLSDTDPYNYGTLANGGTADRTFTVTNSGGVTATGISGSGLAAPYTFKGGTFPGTGGTCTGGTLGAGANCSIIVTYSPTLLGTQTDTVIVSYNDGVAAQSVQRDLTGTAVAPASVTISDSPSYDFGTKAVGSSSDKAFTLTNGGAFTASSLGGTGLAAPFSFKGGGGFPGTGGTCGLTIAPAATCTMVVTYAPTGTGSHNDTIDIGYNNGASAQTSSRDVQGVGAAPALLDISGAPTYDFGNRPNGSSVDATLTVTNNGGVTATALGGSGLVAPFSFKGGSFPGTGGTCVNGGSLAVANSCTIVVTYAPLAIASHTGTVTVSYNDGAASVNSTRGLAGAGVAPASLTISGGPTYDFGTLATGASVDQTFTVTNSGSFTATSLSGSGLAAPYTFKGGSFPGTGGSCVNAGTLAASGTCTIVVTFAPVTQGTLTDTVIVGYNNGASNVTATLDYTGVGAAPAVLASSVGTSYDFGTKANGSSTDLSITINNSGGVPATGVSMGGLAAPYSFKGGSYPGTGGNCTNTISNGGSCTVVVTFNPGSSNTHNDTLNIAYTDGAAAQTLDVAFTGVSVAPASLTFSDGPTYDFGTLANTTSADKSFTVTNGGAVAATAMADGFGLAAPYSFKGGSYPGTGGSCSTSLNPAQSCTVFVTFNPTSSGSYSDTILLSYNNGASVTSASRDLTGVGAPVANITISDGATYNFGTVANGSTGNEKTFTLTNAGGVTASSLAGSGLAAPFSFKGGSFPGTGGTCVNGGTLPATATCTMVVVYSPSTIATHTDTIDITYNNGISGQTSSRDLSGTAVAPASLTLSDGPSYNYGTIANGATLDKTFTVTNGGSFSASSLSGSGLAAPFDFKGGTFPGTGGSCVNGGSLAAAGTCTIVVTFAPGTTGSNSDTIVIGYNNGATTTSVTGDVTGDSAGPAVLTIGSGPTYDYGTVATTTTKDRSFTVSNSGGVPATSLSGSGLGAPYSFKGGTFPGTGGSCTGPLGAGASCTIIVTFSPSISGVAGDTIEVNYNDGVTAQMTTRPVTGTGALPANITITDNPLYDYGSIPTGASADRTFTLTNTGAINATLLVVNGLTAPFGFKDGSYPGTGGNCGGSLNVGASCTVVVTFAPTATGSFSNSISVSYNDGAVTQNPTRDIQGVGAAPALLTISDGVTYNYGSIANGGSADKSFTVTNSGGVSATSIAEVGLAAPYGFKGGIFPGTGGNCTTSLSISSNCTIVITFSPSSLGAQSDSIDLNYNNGVSVVQTNRAITGTAVAPASLAFSNGPTYDFGTLYTNATAEKVFTITNNGSFTASSMAAGGGMALPFSYKGGLYPGTGGTCGASLAPSGTCSVAITYAPTIVNTDADDAEITYNDGANLQTATRTLTGAAIAPIPPGVPGTPVIAITAFSQLDLTWSAPTTGTAPFLYDVLRSTTSGSGYTVVSNDQAGLTFTDTGVTAGTTYYYKIRAQGIGGNTDSLETNAKALGAFSITTVEAKNLSLLVTWAASAGASSYTVKYGTSSGSYGFVSSTNATSPHTITGLTAGTTYYVMVQAVNPAGTMDAPGELTGIPKTVPLQLSQSSGQHTMCAIMSNGQLRCWGRTRFGNLGNASESQLGDSPEDLGSGIQFVDFGTGRTATAVYSGATSEHACAILDNNTVKCWGRNNVGQLGYGDTTNRGGTAGTIGDSLSTVSLPSGYTPIKLALGTDFTCALLQDGSSNKEIRCWGRNNAGQLGVGNTNQIGDAANEMGNNLAPVTFGDTNGNGTGVAYQPIDLAAGADHACAILDNNKIKCWGAGGNGRLGTNSTNARGDNANEMGNFLPFVDLGVGVTVTAVSAGSAFTCVIDNSQAVRCWGAGANGRIGYGNLNDIGDNENPSAAGTVSLGTTVSKIFSGSVHSCVILTNNTVRCWGNGGNGRLGTAGTADIGDNEVPSSIAVTDVGTATPSTMSIGLNHTCARMTNGTAVCWGANTYGYLANQDATLASIGDNAGEMGNPLVEIDVTVSRTITAVASASEQTCARLDNGKVACFGNNIYGRLGIGKPAHTGDEANEMGVYLTEVNLGTGRTAKKVAVGDNHICAILDTNQVKCWGRNFYGQLGYGNTTNLGGNLSEMGDALGTVDLGVGRTAKEIAAGDNHTCVIMDNNSVKCWGRGNKGQLGYNGTASIGDNELPSAVGVVTLGGGRTAKKIAAGLEMTCAILSDDAVKCWGEGANGRLGNNGTARIGDNEAVSAGADVSLGAAATEIAVGVQHACAILTGGVVRCWGDGSNGRLGYGNINAIGDNELVNSVSAVTTGGTPTKITAGTTHTCVLRSDGTVVCWGQGNNGRLGYGNTTQIGDDEAANTNGAVSLGTNIIATAIGNANAGTCAITQNTSTLDEGLKCWGYNFFGTLGIETNVDRGSGAGQMGDSMPYTSLW